MVQLPARISRSSGRPPRPASGAEPPRAGAADSRPPRRPGRRHRPSSSSRPRAILIGTLGSMLARRRAEGDWRSLDAAAGASPWTRWTCRREPSSPRATAWSAGSGRGAWGRSTSCGTCGRRSGWRSRCCTRRSSPTPRRSSAFGARRRPPRRSTAITWRAWSTPTWRPSSRGRRSSSWSSCAARTSGGCSRSAAASRRRGRRLARADGARARQGARARHRPPRSQAREPVRRRARRRAAAA